MSLNSRIEALRAQHQDLSEKVECAARQPGHDQFEVSQMKKQKLYLKEEIARLATQ